MRDQDLAALYAQCFPEDKNLWGARSFEEFRKTPNHYLDASEKGAFLGLITKDEAEIVSLFVAPSYRRLGIAQSLWENFERHCLNFGVRSVFLEVAEDNHGARAFYKGQGFAQVGKRPHYYSRKNGAKVTALVFKKLIS